MVGYKIIRKYLVVGIILLFIGTCVIPAIAQNTEKSQSASRGNWLYVGGSGPGNYSRIQDAVNDSSNGDTIYVYDDSSPYYTEITIEKSINLLGENHNTIIEGMTEESISITVRTDHVTMNCFSIMNSYIGVMTDSGNNTLINDIYFIDNFVSILLDSNNNIVSNNSIKNSGFEGISLSGYARNNSIRQNEITGCWSGIDFNYASDCSIYRNEITKNENGIIFYTPDRENRYNFKNVIVQYNNITENAKGISIIGMFKDSVIEHNNFINNNKSIYYKIFLKQKIKITENFWGRTLLLPKAIPGVTLIYLYSYFLDRDEIKVFLHLPKIIYDWNPAQEPYDIPGMS